MNARFYAPDAEKTGDLIALPDDEAQHLARVLRLKPGAAIRVFNGRGHEFDARVESVAKSGVRVMVESDRPPTAREAGVAITLAQAVLKGDKMDDVVRDAVMVGAAAVQPIVSERTEITLASLARSARRERWHRVAVSAAKQSGRTVVPPVLEPQTFEATAQALAHMWLPGPGVMFVEPAAAADPLTLADMDGPPPRQATVVIGPEGGWSASEIERAMPVCRLVTLGGRTLRADAMPLVALAALFALWKEF